ncbi:hypothetical protein J7E29_02500 [Streptomyces sp. ISL-90]|nr:hypothetical protein [Streptomyces sp. ISL-90]
MIPALLPNGHLPPGRHPASLQEIEDRFVSDEGFSSSASRSEIWEGFLSYLSAWDAAERALGATVLRAIWLAGSFISSKHDPSDIDVSPIYDKTVLAAHSGRPGVGGVKRLFEQRSRVVDEFRVEPFALPWLSIASTLLPAQLPAAERDALSVRGGVDSWWGRTRPAGARVAPVPPTTLADRGFLEVLL